MDYPIQITHELIMETTKYYPKEDIKYANEDFDRIDSILERDNLIGVRGLIHLYGYKIAGDGLYNGFYDVINQRFYTSEFIKNATIIEEQGECIYNSPVKPSRLRL